LITAIPAISSLGMMLALIIFMYAVIGISLFGQIKWSDGSIDYHSNF